MGAGWYAELTVAAYRAEAPAAIASWEQIRAPSKFLRRFAAQLPPHSRVLDYGCGIGTDLQWMRRQGLRVEGIDATPEFVREARRRCPRTPIRLERFETVTLPARAFNGIWSNAALIHVPSRELPAQLRKLALALKPKGVLGVSFAWGRSEGVLNNDWISGRYVAVYRKLDVQRFFCGWRVESLQVKSGDGRAGRWVQVLARPEAIGRQGLSGRRPWSARHNRCRPRTVSRSRWTGTERLAVTRS